MASYKNIRSVCSETKTLDRLSGFETQVSYDPKESRLYADTNTIGSKVVYNSPIVTLGFVRSPMTMAELTAWADEKIAERNAENRWYGA